MRNRARRVLARLQLEPSKTRFLLGRALSATRICDVIAMYASVRGVQIRLRRPVMSANLWADPHRYDSPELEALLSVLRAGDVVVDVGANIGLFTLLSAQTVGSIGRVFAFEPQPTIFKCLEENLAENAFDWVDARQIAVGSNEGWANFSQDSTDDRNTFADAGSLRVPVASLDSLLADVPLIRVIKIDVEGSEEEVLRGAADVLKRTEYIVLEFWGATNLDALLPGWHRQVVSADGPIQNVLCRAPGVYSSEEEPV